MNRILVVLLALMATLVVQQVHSQSGENRGPAAFDDVFTITGETVLEGDETVPLTAITNPHITEDRIYLTDFQSHQIAIYDHESTRLAETGQSGQGPGDVQMPFEMKPGPES